MAIHAPLRTPAAEQTTASARSESDTSIWRHRPPLSILILALATLSLAGGAFAFALVETITPTQSAHIVEIAPATPTSFTPEQVAAAKLEACTSWKTAATAMTKASNSVADLPPGWDAPARQAARAAETKVVLSQTALLRSRVHEATPPAIRADIARYNVLSIAQQDAAIHRQGPTEDSLIDDQNAVGDRIKSACGLS